MAQEYVSHCAAPARIDADEAVPREATLAN
jgi:hypothetical protein